MPRLRFFATAALALAPMLALAHAKPDLISPANDSVVAPPAAIRMHFTETLEPALSAIELEDAAGKPVPTGHAEVPAADRHSLQLPLPTLAAGPYTVRWTVVSTDGHRTRGRFRFTVK